jgi:nitroreductase
MSRIRKNFPWFFPSYNIILGYLHDCIKFIKFNTNNNYLGNKKKHEAIIIRMSHGLEKAFSLPTPKKSFGKANSAQLIIELTNYYEKYGYDNLVKSSIDVLVHYKEYHIANKIEHFDDVYSLIDSLIQDISEYKIEDKKLGGITKILKQDIVSTNMEIDFKKFFYMRYSVRDFSVEDEISDDLIMQATSLALKTPSACNRQAWKVHVFKGKKAKEILQYQNGNGGFTQSIETVLLITGLTTSFSNAERNQVFIDGGLFSMSLMLAFHSFSVGTCPLNTAYKVKDEKLLYEKMNIPEDEVPIMMLAVGHLKESFLVSNSPRKISEDILRWHNV